MSGVAISAGYYLMAKLGMHLLVEFPAADFFEPGQVEVRSGIIVPGKLPRSRLFLWNDPNGRRDLILFLGEAQPTSKGTAFCHRLIDQSRALGVSRVFTFAAMATQMRPRHPSRVFAAATDQDTLALCERAGLIPLAEGSISGLNGTLLGLAATTGLPGGCLLGEIPHVFSQIPFPKASLAVLQAFAGLAGIHIDYRELKNHAKAVEHSLEEFLSRMEHAVGAETESSPLNLSQTDTPMPPRKRGTVHPEIERLFTACRTDRTHAYELKQLLDELGVFSEYEDRFLDLFKDENP